LIFLDLDKKSWFSFRHYLPKYADLRIDMALLC